jgi:NACHT conflict system protein
MGTVTKPTAAVTTPHAAAGTHNQTELTADRWPTAAILVVVVLDEAALGVGRQIVKQVVRAWLGVRRAEADRNSELVDLVAVSVVDSFHRRRLLRQLEAIGDQAADRLKPLYEHEFATCG